MKKEGSKEIREGVFFPGHKVERTYTHFLNRKSSTEITKTGVLQRQVRSRRSGLERPTGYWMVLFEGNMWPSKVHESKLINLTLIPSPK